LSKNGESVASRL